MRKSSERYKSGYRSDQLLGLPMKIEVKLPIFFYKSAQFFFLQYISERVNLSISLTASVLGSANFENSLTVEKQRTCLQKRPFGNSEKKTISPSFRRFFPILSEPRK